MAAGTNCQITVTFLPTAPGQRSATLTIVDSDPSSPTSLSLTGVGALGSTFVPVTPCRIADTRNANGPYGGPIMAGKSTREFVISGNCGIPSTATAYSLNVTVVPSGILGYLSIWPSNQTQPVVSTLNSDGRVKANAAIVPAGTDGGVNVYVSQDSQVILDINGYFQPAGGSGLSFYPMTPCRVADTRNAASTFGSPSLAGNVERTFPVLSSACNLPSTAQAYSLNFTAIPKTSPIGFLSTWPTGQSQPEVSTLNTSTLAVTANAAIVPAGPDGGIEVLSSNDADLVIDINGYFAPLVSGGLSLYTVTPCRADDTRISATPLNGAASFPIATSPCGVPSAAQAYVLNATVVPVADLGFLTLWPNGAAQPLASTLNASDGAVTSNMAIIPTTDGKVGAYASQSTDLILDVSSYFAP